MKGGPWATDKTLLMFADGALDDRAWKVKSENYREIYRPRCPTASPEISQSPNQPSRLLSILRSST